MSYKYQTIAIQHAGGLVSRMQAIIEAPLSAFDAIGAANAGFVFDGATQLWKRTLNTVAIQREISRANLEPKYGAVVRWKKAAPDDFPALRVDFDSRPER